MFFPQYSYPSIHSKPLWVDSLNPCGVWIATIRRCWCKTHQFITSKMWPSVLWVPPTNRAIVDNHHKCPWNLGGQKLVKHTPFLILNLPYRKKQVGQKLFPENGFVFFVNVDGRWEHWHETWARRLGQRFVCLTVCLTVLLCWVVLCLFVCFFFKKVGL